MSLMDTNAVNVGVHARTSLKLLRRGVLYRIEGIKIGKILIHRKNDGDMGKEIKYHRLPEVSVEACLPIAGGAHKMLTTSLAVDGRL